MLLLVLNCDLGSETTTTCLRWLLVYFLHWPNTQEEVYQEIIKVVGTERYPDLDDQANLHLTQATIQEALRLSSVSQLGVPRTAVKDSSIGGKFQWIRFQKFNNSRHTLVYSNNVVD